MRAPANLVYCCMHACLQHLLRGYPQVEHRQAFPVASQTQCHRTQAARGLPSTSVLAHPVGPPPPPPVFLSKPPSHGSCGEWGTGRVQGMHSLPRMHIHILLLVWMIGCSCRARGTGVRGMAPALSRCASARIVSPPSDFRSSLTCMQNRPRNRLT